jgi:DNA-binding SARP family transcriptional activator
MLEVKLFGAGAACYFDRPMDGFPSHQSYQVFCYLLLNREHKQNRERLASVFWGNYATQASRKYLRNALWKLRSIFQSVGAELEDFVHVDDDNVTFQKSSPYRLDVEVFEALLAGTRSLAGEDLRPDQASQLEQAVNLYAGDLLEGVEEEWCLYERERLSLLHLATLSKLIVYQRVHGNYTAGLDYGERILAFDNTRESVHREMMLLYWLSGEPQMALAQYNRCVQILRGQIGVVPTEETNRLYEQMLHHRFEPSCEILRPKSLPESVRAPSPDEVTEFALLKIQHLMQVVEETNLELHRLEEYIRRARMNCG